MKKLILGSFFIVLIFIFSTDKLISHSASADTNSDNSLYTGKFVDAHAHYISKILSFDQVIKIMDKAGIDQIVLFVNPGELENNIEKYPNRIIPFLSPYKYYKMTGEKKLIPRTISLADKELSKGRFKGFGEILLRLHKIKFAPDGIHVPADSPDMLKVYDIAAKYNIPVNLHIDNEYSSELENALAHNRNTKIIWAHCGYSSHEKIRKLFSKHPNLYGDLSILADPTKGRSRMITDDDNILLPEWKKIFEDYSHRLMFGSDMGMSISRYNQTPEIINHYRKLLYQLKPEAAENLAYKTILSIVNIQ